MTSGAASAIPRRSVPTQVTGRNRTILRTKSQRIPAKVHVLPAEGVESKDDLERSWAPRSQLRAKSEKSLQDGHFRARNRRDQARSKTDLMRRKRHLLQIAEKSIQRVWYVRSWSGRNRGDRPLEARRRDACGGMPHVGIVAPRRDDTVIRGGTARAATRFAATCPIPHH